MNLWKKKTTTFWLSYLNECPELLCGLSCNHSGSQTTPTGNSPLEKRISQGTTLHPGLATQPAVRCPGGPRPQRQGQALVPINGHNPTMNPVEEKQRGLIPQAPRAGHPSPSSTSPTLPVPRHPPQVQPATIPACMEQANCGSL